MSEGWNILVVDDEPPIRAELRYLLEKDARVGQIAEAGNVTEAVESILSNKPDVLFLDITAVRVLCRIKLFSLLP